MSQTHSFQAEVNQLLHLVIHSLYSNKEIFLRELVSNASDALDKLRFRAVTEPELLADGQELEIRIYADKANHTLTIEDSGIGMTQEELVKNLGTIAHSGSKEFLQEMQKAGTQGANLIGQFGVGFYSAYLVADKVEVISRAAGTTQAHVWTSDAKGTFSIDTTEKATSGTKVVLHLKEDQRSYLEIWRLKELVQRYSDYVSHPIKLEVEKTTGEGDAKVTEKSLESINRASALWQRPRGEITEEQATEFYKHLAHDWEGPLTWTHFHTEGSQEFIGLLFVPKRPPFDLQTSDRRGLRLYVKRVMVMEANEDVVPTWLRFVRGVIDSEDLPLNVSRELLQDSALVRGMKKQVVKKVLESLERFAGEHPEQYLDFWKGFGSVLKEGLVNDAEYKDKLAPLLRYETTKQTGLTSLADYVTRMPEGQSAIYYAYGESRKALEGSPYLETLTSKGYEVLFMTDPIDEWAISGLEEYAGKQLVSAMRDDLNLPSSDDEKKAKEELDSALKALTSRMKDVLKDKVRDVRVSDRLVDSPCCLVVADGGTHAYMEQILRERGREIPKSKRILELNPKHPLIEKLRAVVEVSPESGHLNEWVEMLYDQALLTEGSKLEDPNLFARRVTDLLAQTVSSAGA